MIYIPPPRCPACHNLESIEHLCRHCGYAYSYPSTWLEVAGIVALSVGILWTTFTLGEWLMMRDGDRLRDVLKDQWRFLKGLRF